MWAHEPLHSASVCWLLQLLQPQEDLARAVIHVAMAAANVIKELSDLIMLMPLQVGAQVSGLRRASTSEDEHGPGSDRTGLISRTPCMSISAQ